MRFCVLCFLVLCAVGAMLMVCPTAQSATRSANDYQELQSLVTMPVTPVTVQGVRAVELVAVGADQKDVAQKDATCRAGKCGKRAKGLRSLLILPLRRVRGCDS